MMKVIPIPGETNRNTAKQTGTQRSKQEHIETNRNTSKQTGTQRNKQEHSEANRNTAKRKET
jgi:hypothetical protein